MTLGVGGLGLYALLVQPDNRKQRPRRRDLAVGLGSAAALYGIFQVGDRLTRRLLPTAGRDIEAVYQLRATAPRARIALALASVIGPGEELFWRGLIQRSLQPRFGRLGAALVASGVYAAVHAVSENLTLTGAAGVAGLFWGLLYAGEQRLPALIVSHVAWDIWIFLIAPTMEVPEYRRASWPAATRCGVAGTASGR